jgi:hypothetical protein
LGLQPVKDKKPAITVTRTSNGLCCEDFITFLFSSEE